MRIAQMLKTHPQAAQIDVEKYAECISACFKCAQICTACADACLAEENAAMLAQCIRTDQDCADSCLAMGRLLLRFGSAEDHAVVAQLRACESMCRRCAEDCARHASHHEHCRLCEAVCTQCADLCGQLAGVPY